MNVGSVYCASVPTQPTEEEGRVRTTVWEEGKRGTRGRNGHLERREGEEVIELIFIGLLVS